MYIYVLFLSGLAWDEFHTSAVTGRNVPNVGESICYILTTSIPSLVLKIGNRNTSV